MSDDFLGNWDAWRRARETALTAPHGFLSITALHWLDATPQRYDGVPGAWWLGPDGVEVELGDFESLVLDGSEIRGHHVVGPVDEPGIRARAGDLEIEVARREGAVLLRPRDPAHVQLVDHQPTPHYPPSREWVVSAVFTPYDGVRPTEDSVGEVTFTLAGQVVTLDAYDDDGGLWLVFTDSTAGQTTYPAGRQLYAPAPDADGHVLLDFNRTINLPCAFTDFTTCPVPLPQNRMSFALEAGEQNPKRSVAAAQE